MWAGLIWHPTSTTGVFNQSSVYSTTDCKTSWCFREHHSTPNAGVRLTVYRYVLRYMYLLLCKRHNWSTIDPSGSTWCWVVWTHWYWTQMLQDSRYPCNWWFPEPGNSFWTFATSASSSASLISTISVTLRGCPCSEKREGSSLNSN